MSKKIKTLSLVLALMLSFSVTACSKKVLDGAEIPSVLSTGNELAFHTSDKGLEDFINDYYSYSTVTCVLPSGRR